MGLSSWPQHRAPPPPSLGPAEPMLSVLGPDRVAEQHGCQVCPQGGSCLAPSAQHQTHQVEGRLVIEGRQGLRGHLCAMWAGAQGPTSGQVDGRAAGGGPAASPAWLPLPAGFLAKEVPGQLPCRAGRAHLDAPALSGPRAALATGRPGSCSPGSCPLASAASQWEETRRAHPQHVRTSAEGVCGACAQWGLPPPRISPGRVWPVAGHA